MRVIRPLKFLHSFFDHDFDLSLNSFDILAAVVGFYLCYLTFNRGEGTAKVRDRVQLFAY